MVAYVSLEMKGLRHIGGGFFLVFRLLTFILEIF